MGYLEKVCAECGSSYIPTSGKQKVCLSVACVRAYGARRVARWRQTEAGMSYTQNRNEARRRPVYPRRQCEVCADEFIPNSAPQKLCGKADCKRVRMRQYQAAYKSKPEKAALLREYQQQRDADPARKEQNKYDHIRRKYGLTREQYDALFEAQGRRCASCGRESADRWAVDHDHSCCPGDTTCGRCIRGILCIACNTAEGLLASVAQVLDVATVEVVVSLAAYLTRSRALVAVAA